MKTVGPAESESEETIHVSTYPSLAVTAMQLFTSNFHWNDDVVDPSTVGVEISPVPSAENIQTFAFPLAVGRYHPKPLLISTEAARAGVGVVGGVVRVAPWVLKALSINS
jgi:hypothetical protein